MSIEKVPAMRLQATEDIAAALERFSRFDSTAQGRLGQLAYASTRGYAGSSVYDTIPLLNSVLCRADYYSSPAPTTGLVVYRNRVDSGLYDVRGLHYSDLSNSVFPYAAALASEVHKADLPQADKLERSAAIAGVMIAESQSFTFGNKRTARAFYGGIRFGNEGAVQAYNAAIDFTPPQNVERLILMQNIGRVAYSDYASTPQDLMGGKWVDEETESEFQTAKAFLDNIRIADGNEPAYRKERLNNEKLTLNIRPHIQEPEVAWAAASVFLQEDYGVAAHLIMAKEHRIALDSLEYLTEEAVARLLEVSTELLTLRVKSLMSGVANGGRFVEIQPSLSGKTERSIAQVQWYPAYS